MRAKTGSAVTLPAASKTGISSTPGSFLSAAFKNISFALDNEVLLR
jgi:hypothetical protein